MVSCICIFIQTVTDGFARGLSPPTNDGTAFKEFFLAFGVILFVYGGASTFPTIQNDMVNRNDFYKSVRVAFTSELPTVACADQRIIEEVRRQTVFSIEKKVLR